MNYVPKHSRDHADSEYASLVGVYRKGAEFIVTDRETDILYMLVQKIKSCSRTSTNFDTSHSDADEC